MSDTGTNAGASPAVDLEDLVASNDTGARNPKGIVGRLLIAVALAWSLFQLWIASPVPFIVAEYLRINLVFNDTETRAIHLAFGLFLAFAAYPALKNSPRNHIPIQDWVMAFAGAFAGAYLFLFYQGVLVERSGLPNTPDLIVAGAGMLLLLEAARRALGPPLAIVAIVFMVYVFFGSASWMPDVIQWKGASFQRAMSHMWLTTQGVFGIALGVSTSFVFLFVLFGSLLDKGGAGNYFIKLAFALLGHLRGGPAKAAVLASAMTGLISGSSIANVVTTGTFTIPLMKRVGFSAEKAGSVEVASSVNGQIMPPVMGAAAFLMVEYVGIPYSDVVRHAFLPASISYIALLYLVHLEALKLNMTALPKPVHTPLKLALLRSGIIICSMVILAGLAYYALAAVKALLPSLTGPVVLLVLAAAYLALLRMSAKRADLEIDDPTAPVVRLPIAGEVVPTGLHYLLPIVVLVWFLMVEQKSPGLSAFWATALMIVILLTQRPLKAWFRGQSGELPAATRQGLSELKDGLVAGARNMIGIAVATAAAGIIVGAVTLTGVGQVMTEFVEFLSGGNLLLALILVAVISLILGMGLPTTANYIVVSSLMAPVVVDIGMANGLLVPLIAVHMFVFYFGIMADVTPPVGLASFAAAAVSGGDPIKTGFTAFFYSLRTALLPFFFIYNTDLLLIDVSLLGGILIFIKATLAMLVFAGATQGYFIARCRLWEMAALLLVTFTLLRPGFWLDQVQPPYDQIAPASVVERAETRPAGWEMRLTVEGPDFDQPDKLRQLTFMLPLGDPAPGEERLERAGLTVLIEGDQAVLEEPLPGSPFAELFRDFDFYGDQPVRILKIESSAERMPKEVFYIPALLLLAGVVALQWRRKDKPPF